MNRRQLLVRLGLAAAAFALSAKAVERNAWPLVVTQEDAAGQVISRQGGGPLVFAQPRAEGGRAEGFRPLYLLRKDAAGATREVDLLYPVFTYRTDAGTYRWSLLSLINQSGRLADAPAPTPQTAEPEAFDVWPFYFSRQTGDPATSYRALFPLAGTVLNRFGNDRMEWWLFPLYGRFQKGEKVVHTMPWPFVKTIAGGGHRGFALWPLFGDREQAGVSRSQFFLWPLVYKDESRLDQPVPTVSLGALPFYARHTSADTNGETYLWPFFGYTDRTAPYRYHQTDWFWPLFVQGRGDQRYRNRWAPFYTHSIMKGYDKTWVLWPVWRQARWTEAGLAQEKTQVLFVVYWSLRQSDPAHPQRAAAEKTHLWPLFSAWDNGAGRRQFQLLSPFEVFFPHNEAVRLSYSPLFALYRFDQRAPGDTRQSWLWDAVTYERRDAAGTREFHLGPLLSVETKPAQQRIALGHGLLGIRRAPGQRVWRAFVCDFPRSADQPPATSPAP
ncbi:MAG: hypothetical protein HZA31_09865 [Opitutae bacterium]|nr:hypothetical protein [Opitutae bacterium]